MNKFWTDIMVAVVSKLSKDIICKAFAKSSDKSTESKKYKLDLVTGNGNGTFTFNSNEDGLAVEWAKKVVNGQSERPKFYSLYEEVDSQQKIYREIVFSPWSD